MIMSQFITQFIRTSLQVIISISHCHTMVTWIIGIDITNSYYGQEWSCQHTLTHRSLRYKIKIGTLKKSVCTNLKIWPWHMTLTFTCYLSKYAASWDTHACHISSLLSLLDQKLWPNVLIWPLTLKNDRDPMMSLLKICSFMKSTCTPNIKFLQGQKL